MHPRKHTPMILVTLSILCIAIAVAVFAQAPASLPTQPVEQSVEPPASQSPANADVSPASEEMQRQVSAAISHVEKPKVAPGVEYEPGVVLITVSEGTTVEQLSQAIVEAGVRNVEPDGIEAVTDDLMMAKLVSDATIDDAIYEMESTGIAKSAQPNYIYVIAGEPTSASDDANLAAGTAAGDELGSQSEPSTAREALNDTYANEQWGLDSIDALDAWEFPALKNAASTVGVGILDNGFNDSHEDLAGNVQSTYNATTKVENVPVPCPPGTPDADHGTHVAGIVGAVSNNGKGVGGVGLNHLKLSLVSLTRESDPSSMTTADVVAGYDYLIKYRNQYNIRVASISLGAKVDSMPQDDAFLGKVDEAYNKGIVTVASAGNQTSAATPPYINYPSDYETVVSVMNLRNTDGSDPKSVSLSSSSNYNATGDTSKNISAPGTEIYSTLPSNYGNMSGTSMAAPHVTGVVGLMFAVNPLLSSAQAKNLLYNNARDIGAQGWDETYGYGEVNASAAVRAAAAGTITGPEFLSVGSQATYTAGPDYAGCTFSSSNPNVLTIDANGTAVAVSAGIVNVSASKGGATVVQQVTVLGPITGKNLVPKGGSEALSVTTPDGCGSLSWKWSSGDESVATVTNSGVAHGQNAGTTTVTATLVSDPSVTFSQTVTVYEASKGDVYVPVQGETVLTPDGPAGDSQTTWSSTNEQVATVDQNGKVTAVHAGGAVISCTVGQGEGAVTNVWCVYVYGPIEGDALMATGQSAQLKIAGIDNTTTEIQSGWTWSLGAGSDSAVATVSESGGMTARKPGTVTITATRGSGEGQVTFSHTVQVAQATLANAVVTIPRQTYSGKKLTPAPVVTLNGNTLVAGTDYVVASQDIINAGSYSIVIEGKGNYEGQATGIFVVEPLRLKPPAPATGLVYNGSPQTGVSEGDGYTLEGDITKTDADEYAAIVTVNDATNTCWEDNSTTCSIEWSIKPLPASELNVTVPGSYVYNGSARTPKPTVAWNDKPLKEGTDYTVSYANNVNAGVATVTVTCTDGNYEGTKTATFTIAPAAYSVGTVTAEEVKDSLDPADVVLTRTDTSLPGRLAITETELSYGTNTYHWTFIPDDANYAASSGTVEVTVTKSKGAEKASQSGQGNRASSSAGAKSGTSKLANGSDGVLFAAPIVIAGLALLALVALLRRSRER